MYIIMYKYSAFRINHKSFRSSMSKNFTVIPGSDPSVIPGSDPSVIPGSDRGSLCEQVDGRAILPCDGLFGC